MTAFVVGAQSDRTDLALADAASLFRALDAVVGGIAHHVGERIADELEHLPVELGLLADHVQVDLLAELVREVAHQPRQLGPGVPDRLHPRHHHAFLQLGGHLVEALERAHELAVRSAAQDLEKLIAREN